MGITATKENSKPANVRHSYRDSGGDVHGSVIDVFDEEAMEEWFIFQILRLDHFSCLDVSVSAT